jgi:hypothetical protein
MTVRQTRAERAATPLAREAIRKIAESSGGCLRPIQLRRTDSQTGEVTQVMVPCGATLARICPPCAERAKLLRAVQCREGWHLEAEPDLGPPGPDESQEFWLTLRCEAQLRRDRAVARARRRLNWTRCSANSMSRSPGPGSVARSPPAPAIGRTARQEGAGSGPPGAARTPRRCPRAASLRALSAGCSPPRMASRTGRRCSSP